MSDRIETAALSAVSSFLEELHRAGNRPRTIVVAFSGGPDSTALLWALRRYRRSFPDLRLVAAHLDHGLDPQSAERADAAVRLAQRIGLVDDDIVRRRLERHRLDATPSAGDPVSDGMSVEAWARRRRYAFLCDVALAEEAEIVATAHHGDDQVETVALRLLYGSGLRGLAGVRPMRELTGVVGTTTLMRPLLGVRRRDIEETLELARTEIPDLVPLDDPTNADPDQPRARLRHHLLPRLRAAGPHLEDAMGRVAGAARRFGARLDRWFETELRPRSGAETAFDFLVPADVSVPLDAFLGLPPVLRNHALAFLHARAGRPYPPTEAAMTELARQLNAYGAGTTEVGVDCGDGYRWRVVGGADERRLQLQARIPGRPFTYTFDTPGVVHVPEIFLSLHCEPSEARPWMFRGEVLRTGLALPPGVEPTAVVRNRRAGDRLRPFGGNGSRTLKEVLIDRKVPRSVRDRLPLLFLDGILAWVPGVTVDESFRLPTGTSDRRIWVAELRTWPSDETSSYDYPVIHSRIAR